MAVPSAAEVSRQLRMISQAAAERIRKSRLTVHKAARSWLVPRTQLPASVIMGRSRVRMILLPVAVRVALRGVAADGWCAGVSRAIDVC